MINEKGEGIAWLIEEISNGYAKAIYYIYEGSFTQDAWEAKGFPIEELAQEYIDNNKNVFSIHKVKAIEHMFLK
ncbi:MAG: hypothetical protein QQN55_03680 [Nitrosopumilus sp.]